jgi:membrane protein required for colicin V production
MHWLDILILVVLGIGAAMGFYSGLLWQVARVVSLGVSLYAAVIVNTEATAWLAEQWKDTNLAFNHIVAFVGVFILVYLILYLITRLLHKAIKATKLETMDRLLGALLGVAKMAAVVSCVCAVLTALALPLFQEWFEQSTLAPYFAKGTELAIGWVPQEYRDKADDGVQQVRDQLQKKLADATIDTLKAEAARK